MILYYNYSKDLKRLLNIVVNYKYVKVILIDNLKYENVIYFINITLFMVSEGTSIETT